jgi:hypothetical protein
MTPFAPLSGTNAGRTARSSCFSLGLRHTGSEGSVRTYAHSKKGYNMGTREDFSKNFRQLLREIPAETTLSQWQYLYREVIFSMGMRILVRFSKDVIGPDPFVTRRGPLPPPPPKLGSPPPPGHGAGVQPGPTNQPLMAAGPPGPGYHSAGHGPGYQPAGHGPGYQPSIVIALTALDLSPRLGKDPP